MAEFTLDISKFKRAMEISSKAAGRGAIRALGDIKDDWVRGAVDIAPLDKTTLRQSIKGKTGGTGADSFVEVEANATQDTGGKRFNYAYYIHERDAGGKKLKLAGAEKKFLDVAMEKRKAEYQKWLEEDIAAELRKAGW